MVMLQSTLPLWMLETMYPTTWHISTYVLNYSVTVTVWILCLRPHRHSVFGLSVRPSVCVCLSVCDHILKVGERDILQNAC